MKMSQAPFYREPPGWAWAKAVDQLGPEATLGDLTERAWELVERDDES